jgi:hypothetical protein
LSTGTRFNGFMPLGRTAFSGCPAKTWSRFVTRVAKSAASSNPSLCAGDAGVVADSAALRLHQEQAALKALNNQCLWALPCCRCDPNLGANATSYGRAVRHPHRYCCGDGTTFLWRRRDPRGAWRERHSGSDVTRAENSEAISALR